MDVAFNSVSFLHIHSFIVFAASPVPPCFHSLKVPLKPKSRTLPHHSILLITVTEAIITSAASLNDWKQKKKINLVCLKKTHTHSNTNEVEWMKAAVFMMENNI